MSRAENEAAVEKLVCKGTTYNRKIAEATGIGINTVNSILGRLVVRQVIVSIGTASDAGMRDVPSAVKLYAKAGTPDLPKKAARIAREQKPFKGSGIIAPRPEIRGYRF